MQFKVTENVLQSIYCIDTLPRNADRMSSLHVVLRKKEEETMFIVRVKIFMLFMRQQNN